MDTLNELSRTLDQITACGKQASEAMRIAEIELDRRADRITKLETVLRQIVHEYDQTYDADCSSKGRWVGAASIPVDVMERATELLR